MKKPVALFMALLCVLLPLRLEPYANDRVFAEASAQNGSEPTVVEEAEWLRETNSETYILSDGCYECVVYAEDKYYRDDEGALSLIDNTIIESPAVINGKEYTYKNRANGYTVRFDESQPGVLISANGREIGFSLIGSAPASCIVGGHKDINEIAGFGLSGENCVVYNNVFAQTDIVYASTVGSVKEYIVLTGSSAPNEFVFTYDLHGGSIAQTEDGVYAVFAADGERAFDFGMLFAVDAVGNYSDALTYDFVANGDKTSVTVTLDPDYMNDPERVYPVVIDPTIMITGSNNTKDSFVSSKHPTLNYYMNTQLMTGRDTGYYVRRTYIGFTLPSSVLHKGIKSAYINIKKSTGSTPYVKAYRVTGSWTSSTITWNNKPGTTSTYASGYASNYSGSWYRLYVKDIVQSWVNGTFSNYGFMLKDDTETGDSQWTTFYSSDAPSPNKPELRITYYGGARLYEIVSSGSVNCMGYALQIWDSIGPSDVGLTDADIQGKTLDQILVIVKNKFENYMSTHVLDYISCDSYETEIPLGYYMVVFRVGINLVDNNGCFNGTVHSNFGFHWRYMTNTGKWAEKRGALDSELLQDSLGEDPATSTWLNSGEIAYTSACVYYLIKSKPNWQN